MEKVNSKIQEVKADRHTFYNKIHEFYSNRRGNKSVWTKVQENTVIQYLREFNDLSVKRNTSHYQYYKNYEILETAENKAHVIQRRMIQKIIFLPIEECYEELLNAHQKTGEMII